MLNRGAWVYPDCTTRSGEAEGKRSPRNGEINHGRTRTNGRLGAWNDVEMRGIPPFLLFSCGANSQCCKVASAIRLSSCLVPEMPYAGENHGHAVAVGRLDYLLVANRASGLNDGGCAGFGDFLDAIREREEGVRGRHRPFQR
jgi:hypothetical protein